MENACTSMLKIEGFSATATMGSEDCVRSKWNVGGYEWEIGIYPAKDKVFYDIYPDYCTPWVVLELAFLSEARTNCLRAILSFQLIHPTGSMRQTEEKTRTRTFNRPQERSELLKVLPRDDLVTYGYLEDDTLSMQCAITVLEELTPVQAEVTRMRSNGLNKHLGDLLESGTGADITFLVADKSFAAHKLLLAARSPVFMADFVGDLKEKRSRHLVVRDMDAAVFKAMLYFIYTDMVPELDQRCLEAVATMAQNLLRVADRYGLDRLRLICESKLSSDITVDTAATTLAIAEQHNCRLLKKLCITFIVSTPTILDAVLVTEGYKHLEASCPSVLTDLLKFARRRNN